jgi:hypothetical protein
MSNQWFFVDCEAHGPCPSLGKLTEFGAVHYRTRETFHGRIYERLDNPDKPSVDLVGGLIESPGLVFPRFRAWVESLASGRAIFVSDNPAYDWQWINDGMWIYTDGNPFGHSGRRISDFYAGLVGDFGQTQKWKSFRVTPHDHNPVNDAMGNVEAFARLLAGERP